jgi:hypothetical protein
MGRAVPAGRVEGEVRLLGFKGAARQGVDNTKNAGNLRRPAHPDDAAAMPCRIRATPTHLTNSPVFRTFRNYATNARNPAPPDIAVIFVGKQWVIVPIHRHNWGGGKGRIANNE